MNSRKQGPWVRLWYKKRQSALHPDSSRTTQAGRAFQHYATDGKLESVVDRYADSDATHATYFRERPDDGRRAL